MPSRNKMFRWQQVKSGNLPLQPDKTFNTPSRRWDGSATSRQFEDIILKTNR